MLKAEREFDMRTKRETKNNKGKLTIAIIVIIVLLIIMQLTINFIKYPEEHIIPWRYQLENDLSNGNQEAMEYYNSRYVANGKYLFDDKYIANNDLLNLATVTDFESTENGLYLYTNDGNGYYLER